MDYTKIYQDTYTEYYNKTEDLIKLYLIKAKKKKINFGHAFNEIRLHLDRKYTRDKVFQNNSNLINLHLIFLTRNRIYEADQTQEIFANQILKGFAKIPESAIPKTYTYSSLIKDIALVEVIVEILRLLTNNSSLLHMFYKLNNFEEFEIREHDNLLLEQYPIYKKMNLALNPTYLENLRSNNDLDYKLKEKSVTQLKESKSPLKAEKQIVTPEEENFIKFDRNEWNEACYKLFYYLVDNYTAKDGKTIKYINIWYFLKRVVNKQIYTFSFTQEKYMIFIKENFGIDIKKFAKAEFDFDEQKSILNSLEDLFRRK